jgi:PPM family protein phosphatase
MTDPSTTRSFDVPSRADGPFLPFSSLITIDVSALTHPGLLRENNEDQFYVARASRALETITTSLPANEVPERAEEVNYAMVVADGMGGHAAGEIASRRAVTALIGFVLELPHWILKLDDESVPELERRARHIVQQVGSELFSEGRANPELRGMGSTLTIARNLGRHLLIVHVGDSRAYLFRSGSLHRLTKDHTYAQMLVDCGKLDASEVADSGVAHILTNALGGSTETVDVDVDVVRLEDGDRVVLCSDGLSDLVDDELMSGTLVETPSSKDACEALLQHALAGGGRDNITVIVAGYRFPPEAA